MGGGGPEIGCPGCGHGGTDAVCPDCAELADGVIEVRRSLLMELTAIAFSLLLLAFGAWMASAWQDWRSAWFVDPYILFLAVPILVWALRSLGRPLRFRIEGNHLRIFRVVGSAESIDIRRVVSELGRVVDTAGNRRFRVGEVRFPGADRLHRAIRVRRALRGR